MVAPAQSMHITRVLVPTDGYNGSDEEVAFVPLASSSRRASFSGPIARRRGSNDYARPPSRTSSGESGKRRTVKRSSSGEAGTGLSNNAGSMPIGTTAEDAKAISRENSENGGDSRQRRRSMSRRASNSRGAIPNTMSSASLESMHKGINPDIVARMSRRSSIGNQDEDEEDDDSSANTYGYGFNPKQQQQQRRASNCSRQSGRRSSAAGSVNSRASRSSRRQSYLRNKDPLAAVYPPRKKKEEYSDLEDSSASETSDPYGYGQQHQAFGYESGAEVSDDGMASLSSSKRSSRRNSCIIRPDNHGSTTVSYDVDPKTGMSDSELAAQEEDDDPDSLLNRAKGKMKAIAFQKENYHEATDEEDQELLYEEPPPPPPTSQQSPTRRRVIGAGADSLANREVVTQEMPWRKAPLTSFYAAPTAENLKEALMRSLTGAGAKAETRDGWGDLDLHHLEASSIPESSEKKSEQSYGASMYTATVDYQEIDKYKQKARRRASLENTCLDIDNYINQKLSKVPHFKPAEGCRNASDFVVRCFSARLRVSGFTVLKHNRSRWSKAKHRVIYLLPDGKTLTWKATEEDSDDGDKKAKRPKVDLSTCVEIRHAWSPDPTSSNKRGTALLRRRCKPNLAGKSFSLIFGKRSLDFTAFSNDQCKVLMEGFSALCFRLKLDSMVDDDDNLSSVNTESKQLSEADWVSTVYGSTNTMTTTSSAQPPASSWGY